MLKYAVKILYERPGIHALEVATTLNKLARVYYDWGKYGEAELLYVRVLEIHEQMLGPTHLGTATSLNNLGLLYQEQGKYGEAEPLYLRALVILEHSLGAAHPRTRQGHRNYAELLRAMGRVEEAGQQEVLGKEAAEGEDS